MDHVHDIDGVALLREPVRRDLFFHVRSSEDPVSRDEAARAVGISRSLAAFHLDRLADAGLLDVEYRRLTGRTGRGAGRPAKLYRPGRRLRVSVPTTRYEMAGELLIEALEAKRSGETAAAAARRVADGYGRRLAERARPRARDPLRRVREVLEGLGFEPAEEAGAVLLRNCPFHELMERHPDVVCGLNESLLGALCGELSAGQVRAEPVDRPGYCCVAVRPAP